MGCTTPARTALASSKTASGMCSERWMSSAEARARTSLFLLWECSIRAGEVMGFCLLSGGSVLPYLQLLTCLFFKHFLQLLQNKVLFFTKMLFKHVVIGLSTLESLDENLLQDLTSGFFCVYLRLRRAQEDKYFLPICRYVPPLIFFYTHRIVNLSSV